MIMKVEWNGKELCGVAQDEVTQGGKGWIVSTIPHPKYGSKRVWCDDIQMLKLVKKFKAWAIAKEDRHLAFAETDGGGE